MLPRLECRANDYKSSLLGYNIIRHQSTNQHRATPVSVCCETLRLKSAPGAWVLASSLFRAWGDLA